MIDLEENKTYEAWTGIQGKETTRYEHRMTTMVLNLDISTGIGR